MAKKQSGKATIRGHLLETARALTEGDRKKQYGDLYPSFKRIADYWSTYLGCTVTARDVAIMMIHLKISRMETASDLDSYVDAAAYAAIAGELKQREQK